MTEEDKRRRRDRIKRVSTSKLVAPMTYWLSRDKVAGQLSAEVVVWLARPSRVPAGDSTKWTCSLLTVPSAEGDSKTRWATWTIQYCLNQCGTYPDDDLMLIRVGEESKEITS